jgi:hypothetical protein
MVGYDLIRAAVAAVLAAGLLSPTAMLVLVFVTGIPSAVASAAQCCPNCSTATGTCSAAPCSPWPPAARRREQPNNTLRDAGKHDGDNHRRFVRVNTGLVELRGER